MNAALNVPEILNSLTCTELLAISKAGNVPRGKNKADMVDNLAIAIKDGRLRIKSLVTITTADAPQTPFSGKVLLMKKFRSYKPDKTIGVIKQASIPKVPAPIPVTFSD